MNFQSPQPRHPEEKSLTGIYSLVQFFYWMSYATIPNFASVYLLKQGLGNTQIGLLIATSYLLSALFQPLAAAYADRPKSISIKTMLLIMIVVFFLDLLVVIGGEGRLPVANIIGFGLCMMVLQLMAPFLNSLGMESINQGRRLNFGFCRGIGSAAFSLIVWMTGMLITSYSESAILLMALCGCLLLFCTLLFFPFKKIASDKPVLDGNTTKGDNFLSFFKRYPHFTITLLGAVFLYTTHTFLGNFAYQIIASKGGASEHLGVALSLAALSEIPILLGFNWMLKKVSASKWLVISGIAYGAKALGSLLVPNISSFYAIQFLQMFSWAVITIASVYYVNESMEHNDAVKGQAYFTTALAIGTVLGAMTGGALIDAFGVTVMLVLSCVTAMLGAITIMIGTKPDKVSHVSDT